MTSQFDVSVQLMYVGISEGHILGNNQVKSKTNLRKANLFGIPYITQCSNIIVHNNVYISNRTYCIPHHIRKQKESEEYDYDNMKVNERCVTAKTTNSNESNTIQ